MIFLYNAVMDADRVPILGVVLRIVFHRNCGALLKNYGKTPV